ncbi:murein biosynthesis integral membrane protein MurJ [Herpetosiphon giganteus]|uniref:murein biosynthesis integral membrane protein MurJ n=1 Tax=Herpetosiphon giganteus TaxID=2029754 RepID=UPI00195A7813|nr:murein biosynthesis integral membrane protein MurJ [Herpetosiphon giganteus]MBM7844291.1 putative peptidoglycan lipid II flippase [Herpetosiphon giganteus]
MSNESLSPTPTPTSSPLRKRSMSAVLNSAIVMLGYLLSRVIGIVRQTVLSSYFGTNVVSDIYTTAFQIPDLLYLVIIGGALGTAFIPIFIEAYTNQTHERAWQVANLVINAALAVLSVVSLAILLLADPLLRWLNPTYTPEQLGLAIYLVRLFMLSPLLLGLGGLAMATLNALDHFTMPALVPVIYNVAIIAGIVLIGPLLVRFGLVQHPISVVEHNGQSVSIEGAAWGVVLGALLYLVCQLPVLYRAGFRYQVLFNWRDAALRRIGLLMGPRVFGQAAMQINTIAIFSFAKLLGDGRATALSNALTLMLLPHGIFALSLATVMFPQLSRLDAAGDEEGFNQTTRSTLGTVLWAIIPAAVGLMLLATPIVQVLFQRGNFDSQSTLWVVQALMMYATALPAFGAAEILIRGFYARQETTIPVLIGIVTVVLNIGLCWILTRYSTSHIVLAGAFSVTNNLELLLLLVMWRRRNGNLDAAGQLQRSLLITLLSSLAMALVLQAPIFSLLIVGLLGLNYGWRRLKAEPLPQWLGFAIAAIGGLGLAWQTNLFDLKSWVQIAPQAQSLAGLLGSLLFNGLLAIAIYFACSSALGAPEAAVWQQRILGRLKRR